MIKVNYPLDRDERDSFENEYFELFKDEKVEYENAILTLDSSHFLTKYSFKDLIIGDIKLLSTIYEKYSDFLTQVEKKLEAVVIKELQQRFKDNKLQKCIRHCIHAKRSDAIERRWEKVKQDYASFSKEIEDFREWYNQEKLHVTNLDNFHKIFDYKNLRENISGFFEEKDSIFKLNACHYCNMDSIYVYPDSHNLNNHFTLDHFIPQSKCGVLAISLYNFVPSCYVCNSKLKGIKVLGDDKYKADIYKYSPTYDKHEENGKITFSMGLNKFINIFDYHITPKKHTLLESVDLDIKSMDGNKTVEHLKLKQRYSIHKEKAVRLAYLQERYSDNSLKEIANILKADVNILKHDIFNTPNKINESFAKLHTDITKQLRKS